MLYSPYALREEQFAQSYQLQHQIGEDITCVYLCSQQTCEVEYFKYDLEYINETMGWV